LYDANSTTQLFEKLDGVGGTWRTNTYPGVGCDVPTHLYSFSFNLNPRWSKELCDGPEILECAYPSLEPLSIC
jgi:cation diffusion facilitator CzcD-associated flavoprotein CzcO